MVIIGELINSTRARVRKAIEQEDAAFIQNLAKSQAAAGAHWIDVNAGAFAADEAGKLQWIIKAVRQATDAALCVDSPRPEAVEAGLALAGSGAVLNSITAERARYGLLLPLIRKYDCGVIALAIDDRGLTEDTDKIYSVSDGLIKRLEDDGVDPGRIFADPLVRPVSTNTEYARAALSLVERVTANHPEVHRVCGLSNVSFGLPRRRLVNQVFLAMAVAKGLDCAILDPLDRRMMAHVLAAEMLAGRDQFCMGFIAAERNGKLGDLD